MEVKVSIANASDSSLRDEINLLVDTGATLTKIPTSLLRKISVEPMMQVDSKLANGKIIKRDIGVVTITLDDKAFPNPVIFGGGAEPPILGLVSLEIFGLGVDPVTQKLIKVPILEV